ATRKERVLGNANGATGGLAFAPDDRTLYFANYMIHSLDVTTSKEVQPNRGHASEVNEVALSADGKTAATVGDDKTLRLWNVRDGSERGTPRFEEGELGFGGRVAFSRTYARVATVNGQTVRVWDLEQGGKPRCFKRQATHPQVRIALSQDGKVAA